VHGVQAARTLTLGPLARVTGASAAAREGTATLGVFQAPAASTRSGVDILAPDTNQAVGTASNVTVQGATDGGGRPHPTDRGLNASRLRPG
jgi:hypothetical protein